MQLDKKHYPIITLLLLLVLVLIFYFDPDEISLFPRCPFLAFTGFQCPGCGSQRAIHCLLHLNVARAFSYNPLLVCSLPYLLACSALQLIKNKTENVQLLRKRLMGPTACVFILIIVILFGVFRNCV